MQETLHKGDLFTLNTSSDSTSPSSPFSCWATLLERSSLDEVEASLPVTSVLGPGCALQEKAENVGPTNLASSAMSSLLQGIWLMYWTGFQKDSLDIARFTTSNAVHGVAIK